MSLAPINVLFFQPKKNLTYFFSENMLVIIKSSLSNALLMITTNNCFCTEIIIIVWMPLFPAVMTSLKFLGPIHSLNST